MIHDLPLPQTQIQDLSVIRLGKKKKKKKISPSLSLHSLEFPISPFHRKPTPLIRTLYRAANPRGDCLDGLSWKKCVSNVTRVTTDIDLISVRLNAFGRRRDGRGGGRVLNDGATVN